MSRLGHELERIADPSCIHNITKHTRSVFTLQPYPSHLNLMGPQATSPRFKLTKMPTIYTDQNTHAPRCYFLTTFFDANNKYNKKGSVTLISVIAAGKFGGSSQIIGFCFFQFFNRKSGVSGILVGHKKGVFVNQSRTRNDRRVAQTKTGENKTPNPFFHCDLTSQGIFVITVSK